MDTPQAVGLLTVECPDCGETVIVRIEASTYPVNEVGQVRVGLAPVYRHVCSPVPAGPGDGESVAA